MAVKKLRLIALVALSLAASSCSLFSSIEDVASDSSIDRAGVPDDQRQGGGDFSDSGPATEPVVDDTPIPASGDVISGVLDNGLRYYILENDSPGERAQLRLAVNAGSAQQEVADSGNAHFLEHMLFNGTADYPGNELDDLLRGLGMEIGPDINAYTSYDETVYELSLPGAAPDDLETGLHILEQWAGEALIDPTEVENERGVVREERRLRSESGDGIVAGRFSEIYLAGSGYENTDPIGTEASILATEAAELKQFYDDWYRPDNMAVVAVGDFDASGVEQMILDEFSSLESRGSSAERTVVDPGQISEPLAEVLYHSDSGEPAISLDFPLPNWDPTTIGGDRLLMGEEIVGLMLQAYLDELSSTGEVQLVRPFAGPFDWARGRRFLGLNTTSSDLSVTAVDLMRSVRSAQSTGFTQAQMDSAIEQLDAGLQQTLSGEDTKQDSEWASELANDFLTGLPNESVSGWTDRQEEYLNSFSLDELNNLFRWDMEHSVPLLVALGNDEAAMPSQETLDEAISITTSGDVLEQVEVVEIDELMARPAASPAIDSGDVPGTLDAEWWEFDNGFTVAFEPSTIESSQVLVWGASRGGMKMLDDRQARLAEMAYSAVASSGIGDYSRVSLDRYLGGSTANVSMFSDATTDFFVGQAEAGDLEDIFQLVSLYASSARVDETGLAEAADAAQGSVSAAETDPGTAAYYAAVDARYGGDSHYTGLPTEDDVSEATAEELLAIFNDRFGGFDDLAIVIVGDVDRDRVAELVESYIPALPTRDLDPESEPPPALPSLPVELKVTAGTDDSGAGFDLNYWSIGELSREEAASAEYLTSIINGRLFDRVREELGASYGGGSARINTGVFGGGETILTVSVNGDPARLDEIRDVVDTELASIASAGPTSSDFDEARSIVTSDAELVSNPIIMTSLLEWSLDRSSSAYTRSDFGLDAAKVTSGSIRSLASKLISQDSLISVIRDPKN